MRKHCIYLVFAGLLFSTAGFAQLYNNGGAIYIQFNASVYDKGGLQNDVSGSNQGIIYNAGSIYLCGNLINNVAAGVFDPSLSGQLYFVCNGSQIGGSQPITVNNFTVEGNITLLKNLTIVQNLNFGSAGILTTSSSAMLILNNGATVTGAGSISFVSGPMEKIGNTAFTFPVGAGTIYSPISISAPQNPTDAFVGQYFNTGQSIGSTIDGTLNSISNCEYWGLNDINGTSLPIVSLSWNTNSCNSVSLNRMRLVGWNGTTWKNLGNGGNTPSAFGGTLAGATPYPRGPLFPGYLAIGYFDDRLLQMAVLKPKLDDGYYFTQSNLLSFIYNEEYIANGNVLTFNIYANTNSASDIIASNALNTYSVPLNYKDNKCTIDLTTLGISPNAYYVLELISKKNEKSYLRFYYY